MTLSTIHPDRAGLDATRLAVADRHIQSGVDQGVYPAAVFLVARHGKVAHHLAFGSIGDGRPTQLDTIFDLASVTKPHTALGLLSCVEDGLVNLNQTVEEWFPIVKGAPLGAVTIRQLATHSSGLPAWKALYKVVGGREPILTDILRTSLTHPAGTHYTYSDLGYILIGEIVARATGQPLDQFLRKRIFEPVGLRDTHHLPDLSHRERIAPTANEPSRPGETMVGVVHDGNAQALGGVAGHAGLFGTATDLAVIASALLDKGQAHRHRLLGLPTLDLVRKRQIPPDVGGHSIGWFTPPNTMLPRGDLFDDTTFGHTGFTGTMVVANPTTSIVVILLTNRVMNPKDGTEIAKVRRKVLNAVASAITS